MNVRFCHLLRNVKINVITYVPIFVNHKWFINFIAWSFISRRLHRLIRLHESASWSVHLFFACNKVRFHHIRASTWEKLSSGFCEQHSCRQAWSAPLLFAYWKVSYLGLLQVKLQFSVYSLSLSRLVWISLCWKPRRQVFSCCGPYNHISWASQRETLYLLFWTLRTGSEVSGTFKAHYWRKTL